MKKKIIIALSIIALFSVVLIYNYYQFRTRNAVDILIKEKKMINILLAGSNSYRENKHRYFALASINPVNSKVGITFIPPSYRIKIDRGGKEYAKIEDVDFIYFDEIKQTIKEDLKMTVPFYITLYGKDVERVVNLLEGIDLFILDQFKKSSKHNFGVNYLDGKKIMNYINSVEENSIYLKFDRSLDILMSVYHNKGKYENYNNIEFITEILKEMKTNINPQEAYRICSLIYEGDGFVATLLRGGFENGFYIVDDISYKEYENEFLQPLILDKKAEVTTKIKILNGTSVPGLARKMRNRMIRDGLNVVEFGTSPYEKMQSSIIINRKGNYDAVKLVSENTGINKIYHVVDTTELHNVLIILGKDLVK